MKANTPDGVSKESLSLLSAGLEDPGASAAQFACRGFCEYYKGDEGEGGCGGLAAVKKGIATGKIGIVQVSHLLDVAPGPARRSGCLINELCSKCGYRLDGCDFLSDQPPADATPCGGYRLLQALLDCQALTPDVVRGLVQSVECRT